MKLQIDKFDKKKNPDKELVVKTTKGRPFFLQNKSLPYIAGSIIILLLAVYSYVDFLGKPVSEKSTDFIYYEVKNGSSKRKIAIELKDKKLIRSAQAFLLSTYFSSRDLKAGYYKLASSMSMEQIIEKIESGEVDAFNITIPEGYRVLQIAKKLEDVGKIDPGKFLNAAVGTEGTLFPDTYMIPYNMEEAKIVKMFKDNFETKVAKLKPNEDQLIIASIVEREAIKDDERAKIAAVYKNRVEKNMLLQADPTIRYGLDSQKYLKDKNLNFDFWTPLTKSDINSLNSNFNTYKQKGLPPAPICNPGIKSIEAAVNPQKDFDYLFFFHDKSQTIHFSKTYEEHLKAIQEFGV
jgi:UPF0755 protein